MTTTKRIVLLAAPLLTFSAATMADSINYADIESIANNILCQEESRCEDTQLASNNESQGLFTVDGKTLPSDAMRDADQQRPMLSASLYVKKNGDVASLPSESEIQQAAQQNDKEKAKRREVLPVKLFPAPEITPQAEQVVISVD